MQSVLQEAEGLVFGEREVEHGNMSVSFEQISKMWSAYLGVSVEPKDVAAMMVLLKTVRLRAKYKRDTWVDIAGYATIGSVLDGTTKRDECPRGCGEEAGPTYTNPKASNGDRPGPVLPLQKNARDR